MSTFKVNDASKTIFYYTVILDKDQIQENKEDSRTMTVKRRMRVKPTMRRRFERIVYDPHTGQWTTVNTYE